jgi:hypothetical protein
MLVPTKNKMQEKNSISVLQVATRNSNNENFSNLSPCFSGDPHTAVGNSTVMKTKDIREHLARPKRLHDLKTIEHKINSRVVEQDADRCDAMRE